MGVQQMKGAVSHRRTMRMGVHAYQINYLIVLTMNVYDDGGI